MSRNVALYGMMGAGKSTVARLLAERLGRGVVDTDDEIERAIGLPIPQIFAERGEAFFRAAEHRVVREVARADDLVISLGGGAVLADANVADLLVSSVLVELRASADVLVGRLAGSAGDRPLLAGDLTTRVTDTLAARAPRYAAVADHTVDADADADEVVDTIIAWLLTTDDVLTPSEHEQVMP